MGDLYLLPAIAAVVLGGTSILGGRGSYLGTTAGVILITLLQSILSVMQIAVAGRQVIYGLMLMLMLMLYGRSAKVGADLTRSRARRRAATPGSRPRDLRARRRLEQGDLDRRSASGGAVPASASGGFRRGQRAARRSRPRTAERCRSTARQAGIRRWIGLPAS